MKKFHEVSELRFGNDEMIVAIDGREMRFNLRDVSATLLKASEAARNTWEVSPSGYGIRWPMIDEDLSIDGLLGIAHAPSKSVRSA